LPASRPELDSPQAMPIPISPVIASLPNLSVSYTVLRHNPFSLVQSSRAIRYYSSGVCSVIGLKPPLSFVSVPVLHLRMVDVDPSVYSSANSSLNILGFVHI
jgi:hypothetical protein